MSNINGKNNAKAKNVKARNNGANNAANNANKIKNINKVAKNANNRANNQLTNLNNRENNIKSNLNNISNAENNLLNSAENALESDINNLNDMNNNIAALQEELNGSINSDEEPFYIKYKTILIVLASVVGVILLIVIGNYVYKKYFKKSTTLTQKYFLDNIKSTKKNTIIDSEFVPPRNGFDFSLAFWIYVDDFYQHHTYWRHIFHKGLFDNKRSIEYEDWNSLTNDIREQHPGCWLHPDKPTLRFVLTIQPSAQFCDMFHTQEHCDDKSYCSWDGSACNLERVHPGDLLNNYENPIEYLDTQEGDTILQYVDIDIPVREAYHLSFVLDQKVLYVYENGELSQTAKFMGEPIINKNDFHFNMKNNYSGNLFNWTYFPGTISTDNVKQLYQDLPNREVIAKNKRINNNLKKGEIIAAGKVMLE